jgi:hypothetical protein
MKISAKKFIMFFLISASVFLVVTNLLLQPVNGDWFAGTGSPITWKRNLAAIICPVKIVLVGPLALILDDPDPAPPVRALACALYWAFIACVIHFLLSKVISRKKDQASLDKAKGSGSR